MRLLSCVGHHSSESCDSSVTGNKNSSRRSLQRCSLSIRRSEKLSLSEYSLERSGLYLSDQFLFSFISARVKKGIRRMSGDQPSEGKLKGI